MDGDEVEPLRGHDLEVARARDLVADPQEPLGGELALPHRDARAHEGAHHAVAEGIRFDVGDEHPVGRPLPAELLQGAHRRRPLPRLAEGRPVVEADEARRGGIHGAEIEPCGIPEGAVALEWVPWCELVGDPVFVPPRQGRESRIETRQGESGCRDEDVAVEPCDSIDAATEGRGAVEAAARHLAAARTVEARQLGRREVEVRDLPGRVDPGVGAPGDHEPWDRRVPAQDDAEGRFDLALHGPNARLRAPPGKLGAVVGDVEAKPGRVVDGELPTGCHVILHAYKCNWR